MASLFGIASLLAVLGIHTVAAGIMTRFFRLRLNTRWGAAIYTVVLIPIALLASTLVFTGLLGAGSGVDLGSPTVVLAVLILLPLALGVAIDTLYVTPPDEYELPEPAEE